MKLIKRIERSGKRCIRNVLRVIIKPVPLKSKDFHTKTVTRILIVRQDSRLGNLVLMTPLLSALKAAIPHAEVDVLISAGFEDILSENPNIDRVILFEKKSARLMPWRYPVLIMNLRKRKYDLAIDVSDGYHFSLNNVLLTAFSGARYRLGYDRDGAKSFLNLLVPLPPENTYMSDALLWLVKDILPVDGDLPITFYLSNTDRIFADEWLRDHDIKEFDSFFAIHPGGKGRKKWGEENFAVLIDRINDKIGVKIVVIGGKAEKKTINSIKKLSKTHFDVLENVKIGQMAAVIENCDMFISCDTGPMHVSVALDRPTVAIFISSNFRVYGPRGKNSRIVISKSDDSSCDDIMFAIMDLYGIDLESGKKT